MDKNKYSAILLQDSDPGYKAKKTVKYLKKNFRELIRAVDWEVLI